MQHAKALAQAQEEIRRRKAEAAEAAEVAEAAEEQNIK